MAKFKATIDEMEGTDDFRLELYQNKKGQTFTIDRYEGNSERVIIPEAIGGIPVTAIGNFAFSHNNSTKNIILPDSILFLKFCAFQSCEQLSTVTLPKGLVDIEYDVFSECSNLAEILVDEQNPIFASDDGVLFDKNRTTLIRYPEAKRGEYRIPETVIEIEENAFDGCRELTRISFPQGLRWGSLSFFGCNQLTDIVVDGENSMFNSIDGVLFDKDDRLLLKYPHGKDNSDYCVPEKTDSIICNAFLKCKNLVNIIFPKGLRFILNGAFTHCEGLTEITLPESLQYIGKQAFKGCSNLKSITLSRKTKYGYQAFDGFSGKFIYRD